MKKLIIASVAFFFVLGSTQFIAKSADNNLAAASAANAVAKRSDMSAVSRVNALTLKRFNRDFYSVSGAVWEKSKSLDKVTFIKDGSKMVAYYNSASKLVGTSSAETSAGVPDHALTDIQSRYKDYTIGSVIFFDRNEANAISKLVYGTKLKEENYLVELINAQKTIIVQVKIKGETSVINQI